jgi:multiple sugar transport system permease protein
MKEKLSLVREKFDNFLPKLKKLFDLRKKNNILSILGKIVLYAVMIVLSYILLSPLIEVISKSFMSQEDLINPEVFYVAKNFTFENYGVAIDVLDLWKALFNSIWFSALLALIQTVVSALTAYAFARYNFKGKKLLFGLLIVSFIIPSSVLIVTRITLFSWMQDVLHIKLMNSITPSILVTLFGQGVYSTILILIFFNFFKQIPYDLDEAACMDGANSFQVFYHIILKLSLPVILTVFLFGFVWNWNESIMTNTFVKSSLTLVPGQLAAFDSLFNSLETSGATDLNEGYKMAGTLLSILPLIILYIFVQRKFIEGIEQTGITGV